MSRNVRLGKCAPCCCEEISASCACVLMFRSRSMRVVACNCELCEGQWVWRARNVCETGKHWCWQDGVHAFFPHRVISHSLLRRILIGHARPRFRMCLLQWPPCRACLSGDMTVTSVAKALLAATALRVLTWARVLQVPWTCTRGSMPPANRKAKVQGVRIKFDLKRPWKDCSMWPRGSRKTRGMGQFGRLVTEAQR